MPSVSLVAVSVAVCCSHNAAPIRRAMPGQGGGQRQADPPAGHPLGYRGDDAEPGMVIDPGHHLHFPQLPGPGIGDHHPAGNVDLLQLHRAGPLPAAVAVPRALAPPRRDQALPGQEPADGPLRRHHQALGRAAPIVPAGSGQLPISGAGGGRSRYAPTVASELLRTRRGGMIAWRGESPDREKPPAGVHAMPGPPTAEDGTQAIRRGIRCWITTWSPWPPGRGSARGLRRPAT